VKLYVAGCRAGLFWCSLTRRAWAFRFFRFSVRVYSDRPFLCRSSSYRVRRSRSVEPPVLSLPWQRAHDRPIVRQPLLRFCSLQRLQVVLRYPRRPALGPSRFDVAPAAIQIPPEVGLSGAGVVPAVFPPCVNRALGPRRAIIVTLHTGPVQVIRHGLSFARRSATRLTEPFHDWAGPSLNSARQRSWDSLCPSQYSLIRGSPHFCGSSPHAVIQIVRVRAR